MADWTAPKLADALDAMTLDPPGTFGIAAAMSMLCEAALPFGRSSPPVWNAALAFGTARLGVMRSNKGSGPSDESWAEAVRTAGVLSAALRQVGGDGG